MTGEIADGWLGTSFTPDAADAHHAFLRKGAEKAGRRLADLTLCVDVTVGIGDAPERWVPRHKLMLAFQLSALGSPTTFF
jgi:alkanesulfonate monooxygenase SsuD/methylene tetrahydromethanopterin reductase-like flavin-dependent oxidoreductase (luciferase family)